jgi:hypothetical protein
MGVHTVRLADAVRPPNLKARKAEEEVVLTSGGTNQNYVSPIVCPGRNFTPLSEG